MACLLSLVEGAECAQNSEGLCTKDFLVIAQMVAPAGPATMGPQGTRWSLLFAAQPRAVGPDDVLWPPLLAFSIAGPPGCVCDLYIYYPAACGQEGYGSCSAAASNGIYIFLTPSSIDPRNRRIHPSKWAPPLINGLSWCLARE